MRYFQQYLAGWGCNVTHIIEIKDLYTRFGRLWVHEQLNLHVQHGEVLGLIGSSGSGKSTLLREMILLEKPVSGSIRLLGQDILQVHPHWFSQHCGVMFQQGALFNALTVAENIALPLREHTTLSKKLIKELASLKIALVGLPNHAGALYPNQLSGGMVKRVALARALALDPKIVFLDEPSAGLDPISSHALSELIMNLKQLLGLTIVIVTHDVDLLKKVTDRIAVLAERRVITVQPFETLLTFEDEWVQRYFAGE